MLNGTDRLRWGLAEERIADGCFETMRAYAGRIFRIEAHLERLYASARSLGIRMPVDPRGLRRQLTEALKASGRREATVRIALMPRGRLIACASIAIRRVAVPTASAYRRGIRVVTVPTRKCAIGAINPQVKYSARLGSVLAVIDAQLRGADEALFMDGAGFVTESTASNIGVVRDGKILTPPCSLGLLAGITRDVLFELAEVLRCEIREMPLTRHELYNAEEAFLSSTIKEVLPVSSIDGRRIGTGRPGAVTRRLQRAFRRLVEREMPR